MAQFQNITTELERSEQELRDTIEQTHRSISRTTIGQMSMHDAERGTVLDEVERLT